MKEVLEHIPQNNDNSFVYRYFCMPKFDGSYHFHSELELTYIESSSGKRFVGSNISEYTEGELVLIGSNIPHCWKSNVPEEPDDKYAKAKVLQFRSDIFETNNFQISELKFLKNLFQKSSSGILIKGKIRGEIVKKLYFKNSDNSFQNFIQFLEILYLVAQSTETELIDSQFSSLDFTHKETERFNRVFSYIVENFTNDILLNDLSELAHFTTTSFCRYFKQITKKTPIEIVMEFRIKHACNLLKTSEKSISEVCFDSGFGNLSHFNKEFKKSTRLTPFQYRQMFLKC